MSKVNGDMAEATDVDQQLAARYEELAAVMKGLAREYGADPTMVEAKAELEAQRAAAAVRLDGEPLAWSPLRQSWSQASTETPGVDRYIYEYALRAECPIARADEVLSQVRAYWEEREFDLNPQLGDEKAVRARPGHGQWILVAGAFDDDSLQVTVYSGAIPTSIPPRGEVLK